MTAPEGAAKLSFVEQLRARPIEAQSLVEHEGRTSRRKLLQALIEAAVPNQFAAKPPGGTWGAPSYYPITPSALDAHMRAEGTGSRIAVYPVAADDKPGARMTRIFVFDVDDHDPVVDDDAAMVGRWECTWAVARKLLDALAQAGARPYVAQSSGGRGLHLWIVFDAPVTAMDARNWATGLLNAAGFKVGEGGAARGEIELFPKQSQVSKGKVGNHISLPLWASAPVLRSDRSGWCDEHESVPDLVLTPAELVRAHSTAPRVAAGRLSNKEEDSLNAEYFVRVAETLDQNALSSALHWLAAHGDATDLVIGQVNQAAWFKTTAAMANAAVRWPEKAEWLWEVLDATCRLAAERHGANYDADKNRKVFDDQCAKEQREGGVKGGVAVGTIFDGAKSMGWVRPSGGEGSGHASKDGSDEAGLDRPGSVSGGPEAKRGQLPTIEAQVAAWNEKHFVLRIGGKALVGDKECLRATGDAGLMVPSHWEVMYRNVKAMARRKGRDGTWTPKPVPAWPAWMAHPSRPTYDGLVMVEEGQPVPAGTLNTWTGFAVSPKQGCWQAIEEFITQIICAGNQASADYLLQLLAWKVQHPLEPPGVALVLIGGRGVGKTTFLQILMEIFGQHATTISDPRHLSGNFNRHLENKLLIGAEEAFWAGNHTQEGVLKHLITSPTLMIERKGLDAYAAPNRAMLAMCSNATHVVPAGPAERRFCVANVSDARRGDRPYWDWLRAKIKEELPAFLWALLTMDLSGFDRRKVPQTAGLIEQKMATLGPVTRWWIECLHQGRIARYSSAGWPDSLPRETVREAYRRYLDALGDRTSINEIQFSRQLRQLCKSANGSSLLGDAKIGSAGDQVRHYTFGTLAQHRAATAAYLGMSVEEMLAP